MQDRGVTQALKSVKRLNLEISSSESAEPFRLHALAKFLTYTPSLRELAPNMTLMGSDEHHIGEIFESCSQLQGTFLPPLAVVRIENIQPVECSLLTKFLWAFAQTLRNLELNDIRIDGRWDSFLIDTREELTLTSIRLGKCYQLDQDSSEILAVEQADVPGTDKSYWATMVNYDGPEMRRYLDAVIPRLEFVSQDRAPDNWRKTAFSSFQR